MFFSPKMHFFRKNICTIQKVAVPLHPLSPRNAEMQEMAESDGPFVYRLGRKIFILERAVRFCYGLLIFYITDKHL